MNYIIITKTFRGVACNVPTVVYQHENCCKKNPLFLFPSIFKAHRGLSKIKTNWDFLNSIVLPTLTNLLATLLPVMKKELVKVLLILAFLALDFSKIEIKVKL